MKKSLWHTLLTLALIAVLACGLAVGVLADEPEAEPTPDPSTVEGAGMTLSKRATLQDNGTYIIDIDAFATGEVTITDKVIPADIILVLDASQSMTNSMPGSTSYVPRSQAQNAQQVYNARTNYTYYFKINGEYKGRADNIEIARKEVGTENQYTIQVDHVRTQNSGTTHSNENVLNNQNASNSVTVYRTNNDTQPVTMTVAELLASYETTDYYYPHRGRHGNNNTQTTAYEKIINVNLVNTVTLYTYRIAGVTDGMPEADEDGYVPGDTNIPVYVTNSQRIGALKNAVEEFINIVAENNSTVSAAEDKSAVAIVQFSGDKVSDTYDDYTVGRTNGSTQVIYDLAVVDETTQTSMIDEVYAIAATANRTAADLGMNYAEAIFNKHPLAEGSERQRIVIMFTDGAPNDGSTSSLVVSVANDTIATAKNMKASGVKVYTIAVLDGADPTLDPTASSTSNVNKYLHGVSSNYPDATAINDLGTRAKGDHYFTATTADQLVQIFSSIAEESAVTTTEVGAQSILKDIVSSSFTLPPKVLESEHPEDFISVSIVRWNSETRAWGTGDDYVFTPEQWQTECLNYGAEPGAEENVSVTLSEDGTTMDITGFDYAKHFKATNAAQDADPDFDHADVNKNTAKIVVEFQIMARPSAITGGEEKTNGEMSGIYLDGSSTEPLIALPVPQVVFKPVTYVVDYVTADTSDTTDASVIELNYSSVLANVEMLDDPSDDVLIGEKVDDFDFTIYKGRYGTIAFGRNPDQAIQQRIVTYLPTTMNWDGYDRIFIKGESATESDLDAWAVLAVIPANSVYYEDTFITQTKMDDYGNGNVVEVQYTGIAYDNAWSLDGAEGNNTTQHAGDVMGWIEGLDDDTTYGNGTAHTANTSKAKASFTFSGTGVDIYSRTNGTTGTILVSIKSAAEENTGGKKVSKARIIDTKAASGDYYQIPVCSFTDLPYGKYTVTITVTAGAQAEGRMTFYLDGVRVYNPIQPQEKDALVQQVYGPKNLNAYFENVRDLLIKSGDLSGRAVFIDEHTGTEEVITSYTTEAIAEYVKEGPKSEVYLDKGQSVVISVDPSMTYFVALKALDKATTASLNGATTAISHTADLYYEVVPSSEDTITITNAGEGVLSITKLRTTGTAASGSGTKAVPADQLFQAFRILAETPVTEYTGNVLTEDEAGGEVTTTETEATETEVTETEITLDEEDITIENADSKPEAAEPAPAEEPQPTVSGKLSKILKSFFGFIRP